MGPDTMKLFTIIIVLYSSSLSYSLSVRDTNIIGISIIINDLWNTGTPLSLIRTLPLIPAT